MNAEPKRIGAVAAVWSPFDRRYVLRYCF